MRGDHRDAVRLAVLVAGPPPHARGSRLAYRRLGGATRPTPACAGITLIRDYRGLPLSAHPRMRGDHPAFVRPLILPTGPPPHARGSLLGPTARDHPPRPTPACAGITWSSASRCSSFAAHPRMRGDHHGAPGAVDECPGPPPHARGSPGSQRRREAGLRPTPACAGITVSPSSGGSAGSAHPRMRGDHVRADADSTRLQGPPPHARGSPGPVRGVTGSQGPTPACAGITEVAAAHPASHPAHPRMRGDHERRRAPTGVDHGPPPHARGSPPEGGDRRAD